jgi:hypothetical protein
LQRTLVSIPLTDEERVAVDDGQSALDDLLERLHRRLARPQANYALSPVGPCR